MTRSAPIPIACTLTAEQAGDRLGEVRALAEAALTALRREGTTLELRFAGAPGVEDAVSDLAGREAECCAFLDLAVRVEGDEVVLSVSGPPDAGPVLDAFAASALEGQDARDTASSRPSPTAAPSTPPSRSVSPKRS